MRQLCGPFIIPDLDRGRTLCSVSSTHGYNAYMREVQIGKIMESWNQRGKRPTPVHDEPPPKHPRTGPITPATTITPARGSVTPRQLQDCYLCDRSSCDSASCTASETYWIKLDKIQHQQRDKAKATRKRRSQQRRRKAEVD